MVVNFSEPVYSSLFRQPTSLIFQVSLFSNKLADVYLLDFTGKFRKEWTTLLLWNGWGCLYIFSLNQPICKFLIHLVFSRLQWGNERTQFALFCFALKNSFQHRDFCGTVLHTKASYVTRKEILFKFLFWCCCAYNAHFNFHPSSSSSYYQYEFLLVSYNNVQRIFVCSHLSAGREKRVRQMEEKGEFWSVSRSWVVTAFSLSSTQQYFLLVFLAWTEGTTSLSVCICFFCTYNTCIQKLQRVRGARESRIIFWQTRTRT